MAACFVKPGKWQNSPLRSAYLLEGSSAESLGLGVSQEAMQGALVTLILIFDIAVFRSSVLVESATHTPKRPAA
jgi:ERCC4-type nuclease